MVDKAQVTIGKTSPPPRASATRTLLQRMCACGGSAGMSGECEQCHGEKLVLRRSASPPNLSPPRSSAAAPPSGAESRHLEHDFGRMRVFAAETETLPRDLIISQPGDELEREADRMAEKALRAAVSTASFAGPTVSGIGHGNLQVKRAVGPAPDVNASAPAPFGHALSGGGQPLPRPVKALFEARFEHDFSRVRVHADTRAAASARAVNALAYTVGSNVVFGTGQYAPGTNAGDRLLAHELAHVVQQDGRRFSPHPLLLRSACGHDGKAVNCKASRGRWPLSDIGDPEEITKWYGLDNRIVEMGLATNFGGTWLTQVQTPPNPVKKGLDRGYVDGLKVSTSGILKAEVVEIKSRALSEGGCARATNEANAYVNELKAIAPRVVSLSQGLAAKGGLRVPSRQKLLVPEKKILAEAGSAPADFAWLFYNSLQNRLNTTFTTGFTGMEVSTNTDGTGGVLYDAGLPVRIICTKKSKGKKKEFFGSRQLKFMVNKKGGISYGCEEKCDDEEEEKKKKKEKEVTEQKPEVKVQALEMEMEGEDEPYEKQPVYTPPEGIEEVDIIVYTTGALATIATLHQAAKLLKGKERAVAIKTAEKITKEIARRGGQDIAKRLDSHNISKLGQKAYEKQLETAAKQVDKMAQRVPKGRLAKKLGPKVGKAFLKGGARIFLVVGILMTVKDAYAMVDQISKGAELEIGFSLDETELEGDTKVEQKGIEGKPKPDVSGDVSLTDTKIDIEVQGVPKLSGTAEINTKNVTITGALKWADGDPVTVNFHMKMQNTTIILKNTGTIKGDGVVLDHAVEISDSVIEIDLPPGSVSEARSTGQPITIKGAKVKVTEVSAGGGSDLRSGSSGADKGTDPGATTDKDRDDLLKQVKGDPQLNPVFEKVLAEKGKVVTAELLRRFVALKPQMERHPDAVKKFLETFKSGGEDPFTVLEQFLKAEEDKQQKEPAKDEGAGEPKADGKEKIESTDKPKDQAEGEGKEGEAKSKTGATGATKSNDVQEVSFNQIAKQITFPTVGIGKGSSKPLKSVRVTGVWHTKIGGQARTYRFAVDIKLEEQTKTGPGYEWNAIYVFTPATGVIKSTKGDHPIQFTGGGTHKRNFGQLKSEKKTTGGKKK
jgi:hypothetical protein